MKLLIHDYAGHPFQAQLSRELAARGHKVTHAFAGGLLTPRGELISLPKDPALLEFFEVPMHPYYRKNKYRFIKRRSYEVEYGTNLSNLVRRSRPDLIISGNTPTEPQLLMNKAAGKIGIPVVGWLQDFYSVAVAKMAKRKLPLIGSLVGAWYRRLDRKCFDSYSGIVAITSDFLPMLERFGVPASKVLVIPNWAPLSDLPLVGKENEWAHNHGIAETFNFLYSGTLAMKHNPQLIVDLAKRFENDAEVRIVVVSEGPGADFLEEAQRSVGLKNLVLLPFQPFEKMPEVLATADVLVTVLESEAGVFSVPSKVLTYLCARRAILGAMPAENLATRIVTEQQAGLIVAPSNNDGFLRAAITLRLNRDLRNSCAAHARTYAEREFNITLIADRFETMFEKIAPS